MLSLKQNAFFLTVHILQLQSVLQQSDAVTDALREENDILKNQVQDLTAQVQSKGETDDAIMVAVNQKVDEWQVSFNILKRHFIADSYKVWKTYDGIKWSQNILKAQNVSLLSANKNVKIKQVI